MRGRNSVAEAAWSIGRSSLDGEHLHLYVFPDWAGARRAIFAWITATTPLHNVFWIEQTDN